MDKRLQLIALALAAVFTLWADDAPPPKNTTVPLSKEDLSSITILAVQEESANAILRAVAAERQQIRLAACLREGLKARECGPLLPGPNGPQLIRLSPPPDPKPDPKPETKPIGGPGIQDIPKQ